MPQLLTNIGIESIISLYIKESKPMNTSETTLKEIADFLAKQRKVAKREGNQKEAAIPAYNPELCGYRGKDNTMCGIGCLIPDSIYKAHMEYAEIDQILYWSEMPVEGLEGTDPVFLEETMTIVNFLFDKFKEMTHPQATSMMMQIQNFHDQDYVTLLHDFEGQPDEELSARIFECLHEDYCGILNPEGQA